MMDLKVVYGNGVPDGLPVPAESVPAAGSEQLDLAAPTVPSTVSIDLARSRTSRGQADICVEGLGRRSLR